MKRTFSGLLAFSLLILSCSRAPARHSPPKGESNALPGNIKADVGSAIGGGKTSSEYLGLSCNNNETHRGIRAWRRLSNIELKNTVLDVFGPIDGVDYSEFISDIPKIEAFDTMVIPSNYVTINRLKSYVKFAESLSLKINIDTLFPCLKEGAACISANLSPLAAKAWRRPIEPDEVERLVRLFSNLQSDGYSNEASARMMIQGLVLSQAFLYRSELGDKQGDGNFLLNDWEMASAMAYTIWRRPPDAALSSLAASGSLKDPAVVRQEAERMLADPKAKDAWSSFASMWLEATKIQGMSKTAPEFTSSLKEKLTSEMTNFFVDTMFTSEKRTFEQLLTASYTLGDNASNFIYESSAAAGKIPFVQTQRRGLLGQAGFLASHALDDAPNPITRGVFVSQRLLCVGFINPPAVKIPEAASGLSNKERFKQHTAGSCAFCHKSIDSLGFALENFDQSGKFRGDDAGIPIVVDGSLNLDGVDVPIASADELSSAIAKSKQGLECFVRQSMRFGLGRMENAPRTIIGLPTSDKKSVQSELDRCQIAAIAGAMAAKNGDLKTAVIELVSSPAFRKRLIGVAE
ncbi:MAG: DUF1592 domain-containing protein [Proteobacteria bacterium]|nr:MAG: DUF1592 domain-containing protein [Pseudomonadota bacterium]